MLIKQAAERVEESQRSTKAQELTTRMEQDCLVIKGSKSKRGKGVKSLEEAQETTKETKIKLIGEKPY